LSAFGKENKAIPYPILFDKHTFKINRNWLSFIESNWNIHWDTDLAKDIAYSSQKSLEDYYEYRVKNLVEEIQIRNVSLSGGVALNCKNNGLMSNYDFIDKLFVFNACSDSGISVGAAAYGLLHLTKRVHKLKWSSGLGRKYITSDKISVHIDEIVKILLQDEVVGVFQDGSEFGPRALGNRSIIASPLNPFMKDKINHLIKHRESFRPFGGSILRKHLSIISDDKYCSDHMLSAFKVKDEFVNKILSVVHEDGTSRLHIIDDEQSLIGSVLNHFYQITGVPVLINTSFNGNYEPIIETYENAMETCKKNNINYLITPSNIIKIK
jgi:carbamoyltransferase